MLTVRFCGAKGTMTEADVLTSGMVGKEVRLEYAEDWTSLEKTAVFAAGDVIRDVVNPGNVVVIPADVLAVPFQHLRVGLYGVSADGTVTPTVWVMGPVILEGTDPSGDEATDPTLPVWAQIQQEMAALGRRILDVDLTQLLIDFSSSQIYRSVGVEKWMDVETALQTVENGGMLRVSLTNKQTQKPFSVLLDSVSITEGVVVKCSGTAVNCHISGVDGVAVFTLQIYLRDIGHYVYLDYCTNPPAGLTEEQMAQLQAAVPSPPTAEVGQFLRVAAVDDTGRVTAIEAVNWSGGGGSVTVENETLVMSGSAAVDLENVIIT